MSETIKAAVDDAASAAKAAVANEAQADVTVAQSWLRRNVWGVVAVAAAAVALVVVFAL